MSKYILNEQSTEYHVEETCLYYNEYDYGP